MKYTVFAWLFFIAGFCLEVSVDYVWRNWDGDVHTGGFPDPIWYALSIGYGAVAFVLAMLGVRSLVWHKRLLLLVLQLTIGLCLYWVLGLLYSMKAGIEYL